MEILIGKGNNNCVVEMVKYIILRWLNYLLGMGKNELRESIHYFGCKRVIEQGNI